MDASLEPSAFSIQDTFEAGVGNTQMIESFLSPETASAKPEEVEPIVKEVEDSKPSVKPKAQTKEIDPDKKETTPQGSDIVNQFLGADDEEEEEESAQPNKNTTPKNEEEEDLDEQVVTGNKFSALAKDLVKLGVFTQDEDEEEINIDSPEQFLERFQLETKKGAQQAIENFLSQFGEDYKNAFEAIYVKGVDPKEYFGTYNTIVNFAELDLSVEANQEKVMRQTLSDQGFDPEDIDTEIERLKNYGDLEQVAAKHHKVLVRKEAQKLQQMEEKAEREQQQKQAIRNQYISNVQSILQEKLKAKEFDGIPLNPKLANELQDFLLVDKWKTASGETLSDFDRTILDLKRPENHATKVKVALLLKILEKDPTLSTIQKTGVSKKTDQLFSEVARHVDKKSVTQPSKSQSSSWFQGL